MDSEPAKRVSICFLVGYGGSSGTPILIRLSEMDGGVEVVVGCGESGARRVWRRNYESEKCGGDEELQEGNTRFDFYSLSVVLF